MDASGREIPDKMINITSSSYHTKDKDGNALETEFGLSVRVQIVGVYRREFLKQ